MAATAKSPADAALTDRELRAFAARRPEHWKVPRKFVSVREITKGRTRKRQRTGPAANRGARHFYCAATVAIGFDDRANCDFLTDVTLYCSEIFSERPQRNFRPSAAVKNQRTALGHFRQIGARSVHVADYSDAGARRSRMRVPIVTSLREGFFKGDRLTRRLPIKNSP